MTRYCPEFWLGLGSGNPGVPAPQLGLVLVAGMGEVAPQPPLPPSVYKEQTGNAVRQVSSEQAVSHTAVVAAGAKNRCKGGTRTGGDGEGRGESPCLSWALPPCSWGFCVPVFSSLAPWGPSPSHKFAGARCQAALLHPPRGQGKGNFLPPRQRKHVLSLPLSFLPSLLSLSLFLFLSPLCLSLPHLSSQLVPPAFPASNLSRISTNN